MNETEIRHLLASVMAYDNRKPGQAAVLAWSEAAARARWTFTEALEAVHRHYAESTDFLMPGHITKLIRVKRREASERLALPPSNPASDEAIAAAKELFRRNPELESAGAVSEPHPLGPVAGRIQRRAEAEAKALADLEAFVQRTTPDPEGA